MNKQPTPVDASSAAAELQRLAEVVPASNQTRSIQRDGDSIAVVKPVASKRRPKPSRITRHFGVVTPPEPPLDWRAEREAFERGVAEEVLAEDR